MEGDFPKLVGGQPNPANLAFGVDMETSFTLSQLAIVLYYR